PGDGDRDGPRRAGGVRRRHRCEYHGHRRAGWRHGRETGGAGLHRAGKPGGSRGAPSRLERYARGEQAALGRGGAGAGARSRGGGGGGPCGERRRHAGDGRGAIRAGRADCAGRLHARWARAAHHRSRTAVDRREGRAALPGDDRAHRDLRADLLSRDAELASRDEDRRPGGCLIRPVSSSPRADRTRSPRAERAGFVARPQHELPSEPPPTHRGPPGVAPVRVEHDTRAIAGAPRLLESRNGCRWTPAAGNLNPCELRLPPVVPVRMPAILLKAPRSCATAPARRPSSYWARRPRWFTRSAPTTDRSAPAVTASRRPSGGGWSRQASPRRNSADWPT